MARDEDAGKASDLIDNNLREIFQQELERDLPDRFNHLIEQLRAKDASKAEKTGEGCS